MLPFLFLEKSNCSYCAFFTNTAAVTICCFCNTFCWDHPYASCVFNSLYFFSSIKILFNPVEDCFRCVNWMFMVIDIYLQEVIEIFMLLLCICSSNLCRLLGLTLNEMKPDFRVDSSLRWMKDCNESAVDPVCLLPLCAHIPRCIIVEIQIWVYELYIGPSKLLQN